MFFAIIRCILFVLEYQYMKGISMKRLFIILFSLLFILATPNFASNVLQEEDAELIRIVINSPLGRLTKHQLAIKQDYDFYQKGDKNTLYGKLLEVEEKYNAPYDMIEKINYKYILKTKAMYMYLVDTPFTKAYTEKFYKDFEKKTFNVPDREYQYLDKDVRLLIAAIGVYR